MIPPAALAVDIDDMLRAVETRRARLLPAEDGNKEEEEEEEGADEEEEEKEADGLSNKLRGKMLLLLLLLLLLLYLDCICSGEDGPNPTMS